MPNAINTREPAVKRGPTISRRRALQIVAGATCSVSGAVSYGRYIEPNQFDLTEVTLPLPSLNPGEVIRAGFISDLHCTSESTVNRAREAVSLLAAQHPDVATVVADYDEGCQVIISATMCNDTQLGEMIRGRLATLKFTGGGDYMKGFEVYEQKLEGGPKKAGGDSAKPVHTYTNPMADGKRPKEHDATYALYDNFLECCKAKRRETLSTPELGAAAFTTVNMGVQSYRQGKVLFWDKEARKVKEADASWAARWEERSKKRGKPNQVVGWQGGDKGSLLEPPDYQKLEGPWVGDKDPAEKATSGEK